MKSLVEQVSRTTDHIDILFANAGATWGAPFDKHLDEHFAKVMDLNVKAVFNTIREFGPMLQKKATQNNPSKVIITASVAGIGIGSLGNNGSYGYAASKAAVIHLTKHLAVELGPRHIRVNAIAPGFFPSKMTNGMLDLSGGVENIKKRNPSLQLGEYNLFAPDLSS